MDPCYKKFSKDDSSNMRADDDFRIPFTATELKHSLSEGATPRPSNSGETRNGYRRMHSFHSTLSDNHWNFDDDSLLDRRFLPSDFRDALLEGFPELQKNGFQHRSFDDDIFAETAERFSSGFFSESEIDDIPRSTLFQRTGLRRSTSNVGPRTKTPKTKSRETGSDMDRMKSSRQSKIEELMKLKTKLEELKGSWQKQETSKEDTTEAHKTEHAEKEDSTNNHMERTKEKGMQKRRRLSSLKHSHSLSSKVMEELVEEDEQDAERDTINLHDRNADSASPVSPTRRTNGYISPSRIRRNLLDDVFGRSTDNSPLDRQTSKEDVKDDLHKLNGDSSVRRKTRNISSDDGIAASFDDGISKRSRDFQRSVSSSFNTGRTFNERSHMDTQKSIDRNDKLSSESTHNYTKGLTDERHTKTDDTFRSLRSDDGYSQSQEVFGNSESPLRHEIGRRLSRMSSRHDKLSGDSILGAFSLPRGKFFEDDFFSRDWKRHQLVEEIGDIQRNLADITKTELGKRRSRPTTSPTTSLTKADEIQTKPFELKRSTSEIDLQTQRSNLTSTLKKLLCKKQEREQQIRSRIDKLRSEQQTAVAADVGKICTEDTKDETTCQDTPSPIEPSDEDEVSFILRSAGAEQYIPIVKKNEITIDKIYQFMPSDFAELDITDPELLRNLQDEIDRHYVEQKNAQLKAAELESPACVKDSKSSGDKCGKADDATSTTSEESAPCSLISSAPEGYEPEVPVHVSAECVVCLDEQSNLLFLNCGHVCCCYDCSINLVLCPLCRSEIESKLIMNDSSPG